MKISNKLLMIGSFPLMILVISAFFIGGRVYHSNKAIESYIELHSKKASIISQLFAAMGYGQGIHNFKNFVIRGDIKYALAAEDSLKRASHLIDSYLDLENITNKEEENLIVVKNTLEEYSQKLSIAIKMKKSKSPIEEIDTAVKVDDTPALEAMNRFDDFFTKQKQLALDSFINSRNEVFSTYVMILVAILLLSMLLNQWVSRNLVRSFKNLVQLCDQIRKGNYYIRPQFSEMMNSSSDEISFLAKNFIEMGKSLDVVFKRLKQSNQDLQDYAFIASHDLKEPLKKISNYADLLELELADFKGELSEDFLEKIRSSCSRMSTLLDSILEYSSLNNSDLEMGSTDLNGTIEECLEDMSLLIQSKQAVLTVESLPTVKGHKALLHDFFCNLISNALKFQMNDVIPQIKIGAKKMHGKTGRWSIYVEDNGIGINEKYQEKIFKPFGKVFSAGEFAGTGIGLASCKRIAEIHDTEFRVESEEGRGAKFSIELEEAI